MKLRILVASVFASAALMLLPGAASAYRYTFIPTDEHAHVVDLDQSQDSTVQVVRAGVEVDLFNNSSGTEDVNFSNVRVGDVVKVFQPQTGTPDVTTPSASFTMPDFSIMAAAGSPTVTGVMPAGWNVTIGRSPACQGKMMAASGIASGGSYSATFAVPATAGVRFNGFAVSPEGNILGTHGDPATLGNSESGARIPGDGRCFSVDSSVVSPDSYPYEIELSGIDWAAIPSIKIVLRRGSTTIAQNDSSGMSLQAAQKPLPGDTVDVYRPKEAATPSYSWTIPAISGVYDAGNGLAAVDAPAAYEIGVEACLPILCDDERTVRGVTDTPGGRTIFNFASPQRFDRAQSLADNVVTGWWDSPDGTSTYSFNLTAGDLTSPIGKLTLAKSLKAKRLGKKALKVSFSSSETGSASAKLTIPGKTKKSKAVTLASSKSVGVKAGKNKLALKFSSTGKKSLKAISKKRKSAKAMLTVTLTDASGNVTTVVKSTTIKP